jgi:hypothetical protein
MRLDSGQERGNCEEGHSARGGQLMECPGVSVSPCPNLTIWHMDFGSLHYNVPFNSRLFATAYGAVTYVESGLMLSNLVSLRLRLLIGDTARLENTITSISVLPTKSEVTSIPGYFVSKLCIDTAERDLFLSLTEMFRDCVGTADILLADS